MKTFKLILACLLVLSATSAMAAEKKKASSGTNSKDRGTVLGACQRDNRMAHWFHMSKDKNGNWHCEAEIDADY